MMLLEKPRSVGDLADRLPVSRPAVSQHLRVLLDAELARVTSVGNRRVYSADPTGMAALRDWVDQMWDMAMGSFAGFAQREMEREMTKMEPVVKMVTVPGEPGVVFELFTQRMGEWWPLDSHSVGGEDAVDARVDPGVGGRVYEVTREGVEHDWARITGWEPGERIVLDWHAGVPRVAGHPRRDHIPSDCRRDRDDAGPRRLGGSWGGRAGHAGELRDRMGSGPGPAARIGAGRGGLCLTSESRRETAASPPVDLPVTIDP